MLAKLGEIKRTLVALLFVLGVLLACKKGKDPAGSSVGAWKIGEEVRVDDSTWIVVEARDLGRAIRSSSELYPEKTATGRFVQIHYKVTNKAKKKETLIDTPKIVDAKGREFGPIQGEAEYVPKDAKVPLYETMPPGTEKEFFTIVEVPADATHLKVRVTGLGLMGDKALVETGL